MIMKKGTFYCRSEIWKLSFLNAALIMSFLLFREVVVVTTSHKSHDADKYRFCGLLLTQIVLK